MLYEDQASELLLICERMAGRELKQTRGNLRKPENRAAAVWELIVFEAASRLGHVEYEAMSGSGPDISFDIGTGRIIWIEVKYQKPRFLQQDRESNAVIAWIWGEASQRGIPKYKIFPRLDGIKQKAGNIGKLPKLTEKNKFLQRADIKKFFDNIIGQPNENHELTIEGYTIHLSYNPNQEGPYLSSSGYPQELAGTIEEHAVYRSIVEKARQHRIEEPLVVCIGGDQSPAISSTAGHGYPSARDAIFKAFKKHPTISAVILVSISYRLELLRKIARADLYINYEARKSLSREEIECLRRIDFNRWKYTFPLSSWKSNEVETKRRAHGTLRRRFDGVSQIFEIPASLVIEVLAGKKTLAEAYNIKENDSVFTAFKEGWVVKDCRLNDGNIMAGEDSKIVLELVPPGFAAYWPK